MPPLISFACVCIKVRCRSTDPYSNFRADTETNPDIHMLADESICKEYIHEQYHKDTCNEGSDILPLDNKLYR